MLPMTDPAVEHEITEAGWRISLPAGFERQAEEGSLLFSRLEPHETAYIDVYQPKADASPQDTIEWLETTVAPEAVVRTYERLEGEVPKLGHYLREQDEDGEQTLLNTFSVAPDGGWLVAAFYFDTDDSLPWALAAWESIAFGIAR